MTLLHRRELLLVGAGAVAAQATASALACAAEPVANPKPKTTAKADTKADAKGKTMDETVAKEHEHAGHGDHGDHKPVVEAGKAGDAALVAIVAECVAAGESCLSHCIRLLASGDTSMGECAKAVTDMLAVCKATQSLAASGSKHLASMASICVAACSDCSDACAPHDGHHAECTACKKACDATVAAMKKIAG